MNWLKENWFRAGILSILLLIGFSFFYYYVIFLPQKEQVRIDQQEQEELKARQEQLAKELKEQEVKEEAKQALNTCIADAEESYHNQWFRECKGQGKLTSKCISLYEMTFDEYVAQNNITQDKRLDAFVDFYKQRDECSCRLPLANADRINESLEKDKEECFKRYPQN